MESTSADSCEVARNRERAMAAPARGPGAFVHGACAFFRGIGLLSRHPKLVPWIVAPTVLNIVAFGILIFLAFHYFGSFQEAFFRDRDAWYWVWTGARYFAWLIFWALVLFMCFFTFVAVGSLLTAPFNDLVSQKVEALLIPNQAELSQGVWETLRDIVRTVYHEAIRLAIFLGLMLILIPLHFLPAIGTVIYSALMVYIGMRYLAWDALDYSLARRRLSFSQKSAFLKRHRSATLGLGALAFGLLFFPLTALIVLPLTAVGGTVLFSEIAAASRDPVVGAE